MRGLHSKAESDEFANVYYEAEPPRRRDWWRVLLGRWRPEVARHSYMTMAGWNRELKAAWKSGVLERQMYADNPLLAYFEEAHEDSGEQDPGGLHPPG